MSDYYHEITEPHPYTSEQIKILFDEGNIQEINRVINK
jgi:hypothetical protein